MQTLACCERAGREMATGKQPQNWIKVCYTPHGAGNVPASQTDGRTHAPAIASDAGVAGSIVLHATQYDCEERERGRIVGIHGRAGQGESKSYRLYRIN